jgi:hypothetical protein
MCLSLSIQHMCYNDLLYFLVISRCNVFLVFRTLGSQYLGRALSLSIQDASRLLILNTCIVSSQCALSHSIQDISLSLVIRHVQVCIVYQYLQL